MRLSMFHKLKILWRHRKIGQPSVHELRVSFDQIIDANYSKWPLVPGTTLDDQLGGSSQTA